MMRSSPARSWVLAAGALLLAGCGGNGWFGQPDDPPLPGTRIPVMLLESEVRPDPRFADLRVQLPPPRSNQAWPQAGGSPSKAMHHLAGNGDPSLAWRASIGTGSSSTRRLLTPPVVADGRVFAVDATAQVSAYDAGSGRQLWRARPDGVRSGSRQLGGGLAYDRGRVFLTASNGVVAAFDAASGSQLWRRPVNAPLRSAPTVADGRVLVLSADNQLFALDAEDGEILWFHAGIQEPASFLGGPSPAVAEGVAVVPYSSGEVFAIRLDNGVPVWADLVQRPRRTLAMAAISDIPGHPVIDQGRVYVVGHGGEMAVIDLFRGIRIWDLDLTATETPWVAGDFVFVLTERGEVAALLRQGGHVRWVRQLQRYTRADDPSSTPVRWHGPALVGERLVVVGSNGEMVALSPYDGTIATTIQVRGEVRQPPVAADGTIYLLTERGELLAYR
jgi:outer membrane protein assembly factor BamB